MSEYVFVSELQRRLDGKHERRHCQSGDRIKIEYQPVYDRRGVWHLEESGKTNQYLDIQSHAESCDINIIMARYRNGETDVLSRIQGVYGDVSNVPTDYAEILNLQLKAEQLFKGLSADVREKYGNDVAQFMASLSTRQGWEDIGFNFDDKSAPQPHVSEEVSKDES